MAPKKKHVHQKQRMKEKLRKQKAAAAAAASSSSTSLSLSQVGSSAIHKKHAAQTAPSQMDSHSNSDSNNNNAATAEVPVSKSAKRRLLRKKALERKTRRDALGAADQSARQVGGNGGGMSGMSASSGFPKSMQKTVVKAAPLEKAEVVEKPLKSQNQTQTKTQPQAQPQAQPQGRAKQPKPATLHEKFQERLKGSQFRWLNEQLYTTTSDNAFRTFQEDPTLFDLYHDGFRSQVDQWPSNPLDYMIQEVSKEPVSVVADFGCGEARLAQSVKNKVHSFDLVASNEYITACDMANVPLGDKSVDIAIFCLSLMGTNYADFVAEAHRVLKTGGRLLVAEVASRIPNTAKFVSLIKEIGFELKTERDYTNFFKIFHFEKKTANAKKVSPKTKAEAGSILLPCLYKRR